MTAPYDAGDAPTGDAYRPDPTTGPAGRGRLAYRDVQIPGATPQIASAALGHDSPPGPVSGRSVAHSGQEPASGDIVETAALDAAARAWGYRDFADVATECPGEREGLRAAARAVLDAVTPLIAAQERAKVADEIAEGIHLERRSVRNRDFTPPWSDEYRAGWNGGMAHGARVARAATRPVTGEGDRG